MSGNPGDRENEKDLCILSHLRHSTASSRPSFSLWMIKQIGLSFLSFISPFKCMVWFPMLRICMDPKYFQTVWSSSLLFCLSKFVSQYPQGRKFVLVSFLYPRILMGVTLLGKIPRKLVGRLLALFYQQGRLLSTAGCTPEKLYRICHIPRLLRVRFFFFIYEESLCFTPKLNLFKFSLKHIRKT